QALQPLRAAPLHERAAVGHEQFLDRGRIADVIEALPADAGTRNGPVPGGRFPEEDRKAGHATRRQHAAERRDGSETGRKAPHIPSLLPTSAGVSRRWAWCGFGAVVSQHVLEKRRVVITG